MSGLVIKPDRLCNERCRRLINLLVNRMVRRPKCFPQRSGNRHHVVSPHCAVASFARIKLLATRRRGIAESVMRNAANRFLNFWGNRAGCGRQVKYRKPADGEVPSLLRHFAGRISGQIANENRACASRRRTLLKRHIKDIVLKREPRLLRPAKGLSQAGPS
jgi:hypothetical protein